ncbi:MAG: twin-arginine translocase TatA/TatE family subunit [Sulfurihydrogenibium sp.]|jgi:sec-independent protein translocase protein TatA|uniref:twin-arginine translocase TatA/TatE family subunit n=1 Tax=Sulfurihydrogenibium sp. TaxID=2053621 RepID=UPI000CBBE95F|nr:MAG: twin-arginine translocase TatA/TatE family subunit [Sulfurihydrogenibium sp.]
MGSIGLPELLLIFGILILLFGAKKLPEIGRGLGEGIRSFKTAFSGEDKKEGDKVIKPKEIEAEIVKKGKVEEKMNA